MDKKQNSQLNLRAMRQYLGDKYRETHDDWINSWTLTDDSASPPTQTKGYDCRLFFMANALCLHNRSSCLPLRTRERIFTEERNWIAWLLAGKHQQALPAAQSLTTRPSKKDQKEARKAAAYLQCRNLQRRNRHLLGRAPPAESVIINQ
ncbi:hypothetical protein QTG54_000015 [Skeletonema marinoi]|uniref:Uncharacterized protein n=1 Tax=Skeletonema marinoi TaxID=267567 RepID=A0AAD9DHK5_9STRA|nr:hypothetical protein QTG54_000015 [Skeletonema marinoi]